MIILFFFHILVYRACCLWCVPGEFAVGEPWRMHRMHCPSRDAPRALPRERTACASPQNAPRAPMEDAPYAFLDSPMVGAPISFCFVGGWLEYLGLLVPANVRACMVSSIWVASRVFTHADNCRHNVFWRWRMYGNAPVKNIGNFVWPLFADLSVASGGGMP
jgi:hypothetical protein